MKEKSYSVYRHTNKVNDKKYFGITSQKPEFRWGNDGINYRSTPHFYNAIVKYGWDNFEHTVLFTELSKEEACEIEKRLIKENNTQNREFGYNVMEGGTAPSIPQEVRNRLSMALVGNKNGLGKICSEEKRRKISEAQKGKKLTDEHRKKLSEAKKGKTHKSPTIETRIKISNSHTKKQVFCKELNKVFQSIQECAKELCLPATNICKVCKGRGKTLKGMHFSYFDNI